MNILKLGFYEDLGQISDGKKVQRIEIVFQLAKHV